MRTLFIAACLLVGWSASAAPEGRVAFLKQARTSFNQYLDNPNAAERAWLREHFTRIQGWSTYFDSKQDWYPRGWFYRNAYGIKPDWEVLAEHPEWVLRDASGNMLYVPFECSGGSCTQYAGDFGNPAYRAWWIAEAQATVSAGYLGMWIDDVNMTWRVGDGNGDFVNPVDPRTGQPMTLDDWRRYMAEFVEEVRAAMPNIEIGHNTIWFATEQDNSNAYMRRQVDAADFVVLERGVTDQGLTGNDGRFGLTTFLSYVDFLHDRGRRVVFLDKAQTTVARQYGLAGWLLINNGFDLTSTTNTVWSVPDNWWQGFDLDLGAALGERYTWQTLIRRDFECGVVLLNPPDRSTVNASLGRSYQTIGGQTLGSVSIPGEQALILLDGCARIDRDADGDGVSDVVDNCSEVANASQRDTDGDGFGSACDADFNQDCVVNAQDLGRMRASFFSSDPDVDLNGDGLVNAIDLGAMKRGYFGAPGPEGASVLCL